MELRRYADVGAFAADWEDFLLRAEAENNLLLGLMAWVARRRDVAAAPFMAGIFEAGSPIGAALKTHAGRPIVVSRLPAAAIAPLVEHVRHAVPSPDGVVSDKSTALAFASAWHRMTGGGAQLRMSMGVYEATEVIPPTAAPGRLRVARKADLPLLCDWAEAFCREAGLAEAGQDHAPGTGRAIEEGRLYVWEDGEPVSQVQVAFPTRRGIRVNAVYTPPEHRRRGYASNAVARVTKDLLDGGRSSVFLFTDLANPTSNAIYQRIGYRHVCEAAQVDLAAVDPAPAGNGGAEST